MAPTWGLVWLLLGLAAAADSVQPRVRRGFGANRYGGARGYEVREYSAERDASVARSDERGGGRGGYGSDSDDDSSSDSRELDFIKTGRDRTAYSHASAAASASASARGFKYNAAL